MSTSTAKDIPLFSDRVVVLPPTQRGKSHFWLVLHLERLPLEVPAEHLAGRNPETVIFDELAALNREAKRVASMPKRHGPSPKGKKGKLKRW